MQTLTEKTKEMTTAMNLVWQAWGLGVKLKLSEEGALLVTGGNYAFQQQLLAHESAIRTVLMSGAEQFTKQTVRLTSAGTLGAFRQSK